MEPLHPGQVVEVRPLADLTLRQFAATLEDGASIKMRLKSGIWEVEIHESFDGFGFVGVGSDADLQTAAQIALDECDELIVEAQAGTASELPARHHDRDTREGKWG